MKWEGLAESAGRNCLLGKIDFQGFKLLRAWSCAAAGVIFKREFCLAWTFQTMLLH